MTVRTFALPDLGEGLTESEIVSWRVDVGDTVELNQVIAEVETAKALVELPSPFAGEIGRLYVEPGTTVLVGSPIVDFEVSEPSDGGGTAGAGTREADASGAAPRAADAAGAGASAPAAATAVEREPVLVGYGPPVESGARPQRRARRAPAGVPSGPGGPAAPAAPAASAAPGVPASASPAAAPELRGEPSEPGAAPRRSTPPVRKLAHELGVDLAGLPGTGEGGLITRDDVLAASAGRPRPGAAPVGSAGEPAPTGSPERETRTPIQGVRKLTAEAMVASAFTAPHATEFLTIDVTPTVELLERLRESRAFAGRRLTMLAIVAKAVCVAVGRNPAVNAHWDDQAQEIVRFGYVNLGIAAATPRGLMVPNITDAESLDLVALAEALESLVDTAKAGRTGPAALTGGTLSITNIGVFGIDAGTPILNPGEAAIVAVGAVRRTPWEYRGEVALRQVCTLSLSFDHRLVDGAEASRFLADIGTILSDPGMLLTMV